MSILNEVFSRRIEEISNKVSHEAWYTEIQEEIIKTRKLMCDGADENLKKLLDLYDSLCLQICCQTIDEIYRTAYKDGMSAAMNLTPNLTPKP